jgi:hypothetical protein
MGGFAKDLSKAALSSMSFWNPRSARPLPSISRKSAYRAQLGEGSKPARTRKFAQAWHMLMKGSIIAAGEGNRNAARDAKCAALLEGWERNSKPTQAHSKKRFVVE